MFNPEIMRTGAAAFGKIAEGIDRQTQVAYAYAVREKLPCPYTEQGDTLPDETTPVILLCAGKWAGHPDEHNLRHV